LDEDELEGGKEGTWNEANNDQEKKEGYLLKLKQVSAGTININILTNNELLFLSMTTKIQKASYAIQEW